MIKLGSRMYQDCSDDNLKKYFDQKTGLSIHTLDFDYPLSPDCEGCIFNYETTTTPPYRYCDTSPRISFGPGAHFEDCPIKRFTCGGNTKTRTKVTLTRVVAIG